MSRSLVVIVCMIGFAPCVLAAERYGLGQPTTERDLAAWDIDARPDGKGLPPGRGSVEQGQLVYAEQCATCHGDKGEGKQVPGVGRYPRIAGGRGTLDKPSPVKTVGSFWPYATTLFDYVRRTMPFNAPQSLSNDQVYAVSAYVLHLNGIVPADTVLDAHTLPQVHMPNADGFITEDPRPDVKSAP